MIMRLLKHSLNILIFKAIRTGWKTVLGDVQHISFLIETDAKFHASMCGCAGESGKSSSWEICSLAKIGFVISDCSIHLIRIICAGLSTNIWTIRAIRRYITKIF